MWKSESKKPAPSENERQTFGAGKMNSNYIYR